MLTHKGTQILYTDRLILRKFTVDDADDMYSNWANDEKVTRFLSWQPHESVDETRQMLEGWVGAYDNIKTYNWVIEYDKKAIGNISVVKLSDKCEYAELGYVLGYDYWNKGIMSEASRAVIEYLFSEIGVNRVGISHATENPGSGKVAQKCGMTYEGIKRQFFKTHTGKFVDIAYHGILKSEWENVKQK
ncbi:MAG: GNAT family N-acetyltransferase [Clostridia bacterium]|nr:GNAT family N-acetyltransferase [Clostridia bacterium]